MLDSRINQNFNRPIVSPQFRASQNVSKPVEAEEKQGLSTTAKWAIGLGLTALASYGIYAFTKGCVKGAKPTPNPENPIPEIKEMAIEAFKKTGKFNQGKAILADGTKYTGNITSTGEDGSKVIMEYVDGVLQKSTKTAKDGTKVFEKIYEVNKKNERVVRIIKNKSTEIVNITERKNIIKEQQTSNVIEKNVGNIESKLNNEAQKTYNLLQKHLDGRTNVVINNEKSEPLRKMGEYYHFEELKSNRIIIKHTKNGTESWLGGKKISETVKDEYGKDVIIKFNSEGNKVSAYTPDDSHPYLEIFDEKTGKTKIDYFRNIDLYIRKFDTTGENIVSDVTIPYVKPEHFEEAVRFAQKYDAMSKNELEILYKEALNGNSNNMSALEFKVLTAHLELKQRNYPLTSDLTQIKDHHYIHGQNHYYRETADKIKGLGKTKKDYTREEFKQLSEEMKDEIMENTYFINNYNRMLDIDKRLAELPPLEKDCIFYRGLSSRHIPCIMNGKIGEVVVPDKGYAYTAFDRSLAAAFSGDAYLVIKTPKGARISRNMEHGGEALFPRNAEYRILSKFKTPEGKWEIELEYILPEVK